MFNGRVVDFIVVFLLLQMADRARVPRMMAVGKLASAVRASSPCLVSAAVFRAEVVRMFVLPVGNFSVFRRGRSELASDGAIEFVENENLCDGCSEISVVAVFEAENEGFLKRIV